MEFNEENREIILEEWEVKPKKEPKKKFNKSILIWVVIVVVLFVMAVGLSSLFSGSSNSEYSLNSYKHPFIGTIYVEGTIGSGNSDSFGIPYGYQHSWTIEKINDMIMDDNNKGLLVYVNSPGGGVYESDELYLKIKEYKEYTGRPVYTAMGSMAASGGYYIAAPADKIYANRNTWTGSIGVTIGTMFDVSGLLEKFGVKSVTIAEGRNKAMGSGMEQLTQEQEDILRGLVHEAYMQFVTIVADERNMKIEKAKEIADGRIYSAKQALDLNLIDGVYTFEETKTKMKLDENLIGCSFLDIVYQDNSFFGRLRGLVNLQKSSKSDLNVIMDIVDQNSQFPIAYLYQ